MNTRSFAKVAAEQVSPLLGRALRLTHNLDDAWDLVQDTLERALARMPAGMPPNEARAWLMTVLRNLFIDRIRGKKPALFAAHVDALGGLAAAEEEEPGQWSYFGIDDVVACLGRVPPALRRVYEMYALEGLSYRQISEHLGLPAATVGTRVLRARAWLRKLLLQKTRLPHPTAHAPLRARPPRRHQPLRHRHSAMA
jgi:RNA polymerase sigma-70 factor (ECF subfamily)